MFTRTLVLLLALFTCSSAFAFGQYRDQAIAQFKLGPDKADGNRAVGCNYCHVSTDGGAPWNPFGQLVQSKLEGNITKALFAALSENKDSDQDGYNDALEVFAKTFPGDAKSFPNEKATELQTRFEKAGGLEQYKP